MKPKGSIQKKNKYILTFYHPQHDIIISQQKYTTFCEIQKKYHMSRNTFFKYIRQPDLCKKKKFFIIERIIDDIQTHTEEETNI